MENIVLAVRAEETAAARAWGKPLAHSVYRMGDGPHLFRVRAPILPRGGLMVIDDGGDRQGEEAEPFCNEVLRECAARRFSGVVCRFERLPRQGVGRVLRRLGEQCARRGLSLYLSEAYGELGVGRVLISTAISGGTLRGRLEGAQERWGRERVALWVERVAEDFILPSPRGVGTPLTQEELSRLREEQGADSFFSAELCARYFTYMAGDVGHFVLFDDGASIAHKLTLGEELGITTAFLPYATTSDLLAELLR